MTPSPQSRQVVTVPLPPPRARGEDDPLTPVTTGRDSPSPAAAGEGLKVTVERGPRNRARGEEQMRTGRRQETSGRIAIRLYMEGARSSATRLRSASHRSVMFRMMLRG